MLWIELESDGTDSLTTVDHFVEEQFTDPVWCYRDSITTDTENGPETEDGDQIWLHAR